MDTASYLPWPLSARIPSEAPFLFVPADVNSQRFPRPELVDFALKPDFRCLQLASQTPATDRILRTG